MAELGQASDSLRKRGVAIVGLNVAKSTRTDIAAAFSFPSHHLAPEARSVYGGIEHIPTAVILDSAGEVVQHIKSVVGTDELIDTALKAVP